MGGRGGFARCTQARNMADEDVQPTVEAVEEQAPVAAEEPAPVTEQPAEEQQAPTEQAPAEEAAEEPAAASEPAPDQASVQNMLQAAVAEAQAKARAAAAQAAALAAQLVAQHAAAGGDAADGSGNKRRLEDDAYADDPSAKRHGTEVRLGGLDLACKRTHASM